MIKVLVTGAAGFIGFHLAKNLLNDGYKVLGIDNMNDYYDPTLKQARLNKLQPYKNFSYKKVDISDREELTTEFLRSFPTVYPSWPHGIKNVYLSYTSILEYSCL